MNDLVLFAKAIADPTRVRILKGLLETDLCVCEMVDAFEMGQSTLSSHLQTIRQSGLVETSRRHKMVAYALNENARPVLLEIFAHHSSALDHDQRLQRDAERIRMRLDLRDSGQCCLGPGQLDQRSE
jgi:ArsR family transcriptional regulator